jgi:prophage regulatory protein
MTEQLDRILRFPEVMRATGLRKASLYEMIRAGKFPAALRLGPKAVGFLASEVAAWQKSRERAGPGKWPSQRPVPMPSNDGWRTE